MFKVGQLARRLLAALHEAQRCDSPVDEGFLKRATMVLTEAEQARAAERAAAPTPHTAIFPSLAERVEARRNRAG